MNRDRHRARATPFATGLGMPETPVQLPDGSWLVVEMSPERGCVTQLTATGEVARVIARTGRPNGVRAVGNTLWVAESGPRPALLRVSMTGEIASWVTQAEGRPFLFPNDLCVGPDGALYMTDSGISHEQWAATPPRGRFGLEFDGRVYRVDLRARRATILDDGLRFANGIAIGPEGRSLYVSETLTGAVYRYRLSAGDAGRSRDLFANVLAPDVDVPLRGPDGMTFGADGRLYVAMLGQGDVTVVDPAGAIVGRLPTCGTDPTNVAFAADDHRRLYVTEIALGQIEVLDTGAVDAGPLGA
jgi:gluconolactonase